MGWVWEESQLQPLPLSPLQFTGPWWGTALRSSGTEQNFRKPCDYLYCCGKDSPLIGYFLLAMGDFCWPVCDFLSLTLSHNQVPAPWGGKACFWHTQISKYLLFHSSTITMGPFHFIYIVRLHPYPSAWPLNHWFKSLNNQIRGGEKGKKSFIGQWKRTLVVWDLHRIQGLVSPSSQAPAGREMVPLYEVASG